MPQAAQHLYMSEQGVRRLLKSGKLSAIKEGRQYLIKSESVSAYIEAQAHPIHLVSTLRYADFRLGVLESIKRHGGFSTQTVSGFGHQATFDYYERVMALLRELKTTIRAKQYAKADELRHELWREEIDYAMLHEPLKAGENRQKPEWAMDMLFPDET